MLPYNFQAIVAAALAEDIGDGDRTTLATVPIGTVASGDLIAKAPGVLCGLPVFTAVFSLLDPAVIVTLRAKEGEAVAAGTVIARLEGPAGAILSGERVALNLLQRLSGIATETARAVQAVAGTKAKITDTRKTTPLLRPLEKYAVTVGGGQNHRFGLYDGILIKDNHIIAAGGLAAAVAAAKRAAPHTMKIEVEAADLQQVEEALAAAADIIMLDNMTTATMKQAVERIAGQALTEASGNMGERDLKEVAATGVDLISIGALTHSVQAMDISLRLTV